MFKTDIFFTIGSTHKVCQDYAVKNPNFVMLSDGCSSAPDTDFGSRLLVKSAEQLAPTHPEFLNKIARRTQNVCQTLEMDEDSLCATLLVAQITNDDFHTLCVGDGMVVGVHNDNSMYVIEYEFESGAPYYLRYELDPSIRAEYFKKFAVDGTIEGVRRTYTIAPDGKVDDFTEVQLNFNENQICFEERFPLADWKTVAVMSDGIQSFVRQKITATSKTTESVHSSEIIKDVMSFKGYVGEFVHRRCSKAFKNFKELGIQNCDDFSIGVIVRE